MKISLFEKVWNDHVVDILPNGKAQLFIDTHLIHEVTSPQAFERVRNIKLNVADPQCIFATVDHIIPTNDIVEPYMDLIAQEMIEELRKNCLRYGIIYHDTTSSLQGIVHVVGPELGIINTGITIACGDSHTSTHGAFGAIALGIGTSQVRDVLATNTLSVVPLKVRRINIDGQLQYGVNAKDVILYIIRLLGVGGGKGYAYEYGGNVLENLSLEERMTVCNMSVEGGALCGYINPDKKTFSYLKYKSFAPKGIHWSNAVDHWKTYSSDYGCLYYDVISIRADDIQPLVTWGITPEQSIFINENIPSGTNNIDQEAYEYMSLSGGYPIKGTKIDVAFIGSCTNGRLSDLTDVASYIKGKKVAYNVKAIVVPGSQIVENQAKKRDYDKIFLNAGLEWRNSGCSLCLAINTDKLVGNQLSASSSNRNFKGRQGSPTGRTVLMSPKIVASSAIRGVITEDHESVNTNNKC